MKRGWIILHPDGWVETDYFGITRWCIEGRRVPMETWRKTYRPACRIVRAKLTWAAATAGPGEGR